MDQQMVAQGKMKPFVYWTKEEGEDILEEMKTQADLDKIKAKR